MGCKQGYFVFQVPPKIRYPVGITINSLVILKGCVDPIIYAARMTDIQVMTLKVQPACMDLMQKQAIMHAKQFFHYQTRQLATAC